MMTASWVPRDSTIRSSISPWSDDRDQFGHYMRFEFDAAVVAKKLPKPMFGIDVAIVVGRPLIHLRFGAVVVGSRPFALGSGGEAVGPLLEAPQLQLCVAGHKEIHRVRLCGGFQAGQLHLRWHNVAVPGDRDMPWVAATGGADYAIALGRTLDLHVGVGFVAQIVGTSIGLRRTEGAVLGARTTLVGSMFRLGVGFKLR